VKQEVKQVMTGNLKKNSDAAKRLLAQVAAEKKKAVVATCLIVIMIFMWVRIFSRKGPVGAQASTAVRIEGAAGESRQQQKISYVELEAIKGRHDVLTRDFFDAGDWSTFSTTGADGETVEVGAGPNDVDKEIKKMAEKLKLQAIETGEKPQAFINDRLLSIGDRISVQEGTVKCEFEVLEIEVTEVLVRSGETEIKLKLGYRSQESK
jgi:hypothetical protein